MFEQIRSGTPTAGFDWKVWPTPLLGVDEVGTGAIAGPIVVAGVWLRSKAAAEALIEAGVNDSKKVKKSKRERIAADIYAMHSQDVAVFLHEEPAQTIDDKGHSFALFAAISGVIAQFLETCGSPKNYVVFLDGHRIPGLPYRHTAFVKGDQQSVSIAAASIIAKVRRDKILEDLSQIYPEYGFEKHAGYLTAAHKTALATHGLSPVHRKSVNINW